MIYPAASFVIAAGLAIASLVLGLTAETSMIWMDAYGFVILTIIAGFWLSLTLKEWANRMAKTNKVEAAKILAESDLKMKACAVRSIGAGRNL